MNSNVSNQTQKIGKRRRHRYTSPLSEKIYSVRSSSRYGSSALTGVLGVLR